MLLRQEELALLELKRSEVSELLALSEQQGQQGQMARQEQQAHYRPLGSLAQFLF